MVTLGSGQPTVDLFQIGILLSNPENAGCGMAQKLHLSQEALGSEDSVFSV